MTNATKPRTRTEAPTRPVTKSDAEGVQAYETAIAALGAFKASVDFLGKLIES
jgi:hypothetical protein